MSLEIVRTALRTAIDNRFIEGKELSPEEFETLAAKLFDDTERGLDGGHSLNLFLASDDIRTRLKADCLRQLEKC